jgi:phage baseplate assembly protein V
VENIIRVGIVTQVYDDRAAVRVQFPDDDEEVSWEFPVLQRKTFKDKDYWLPDVGEQVVVVMLPYGQEQGFVIGALYSEVERPPEGSSRDKRVIVFEDGTRIEYDRKAHRLYADVKGDAEVKISGELSAEVEGKVLVKSSTEVTIQAPKINLQNNSPTIGYMEGDFFLEGTLTVKGHLEVEGDIHATGAIIDEGGNTPHHTH